MQSRGPRDSGVKVVHVVTTSCSTVQLQSLLNTKLLPLSSSGDTEIQVSITKYKINRGRGECKILKCLRSLSSCESYRSNSAVSEVDLQLKKNKQTQTGRVYGAVM